MRRSNFSLNGTTSELIFRLVSREPRSLFRVSPLGRPGVLYPEEAERSKCFWRRMFGV
jgi:hypothetical protein